MKRTALFFLVFPLALISGLGSCKKAESGNSSFARIQGSWKKTAYATDDNGDGKIDYNEEQPQAAAINDVLYFKGDSTGNETITVNNEIQVNAFKWHISYADSLYTDGTAHDTTAYYIVELNATTLVLSTNVNVTAGSILTQNYYTKE